MIQFKPSVRDLSEWTDIPQDTILDLLAIKGKKAFKPSKSNVFELSDFDDWAKRTIKNLAYYIDYNGKTCKIRYTPMEYLTEIKYNKTFLEVWLVDRKTFEVVGEYVLHMEV